MTTSIYKHISDSAATGKKRFAVLIDPDKLSIENLAETISHTSTANIDYFFIGGSLLMHDVLDETLTYIKNHSKVPTIIFPGNSIQINNKADAILLLSMISGRNPELLIGHHVTAAPYLKKSNLEVISTGYMLIDGGSTSSVSYMSNTTPIPADKPDIASCTALAGEYLGNKVIYMDAGSGALNAISPEMIKSVKKHISIPLIIGGGIRTPEAAYEKARAGADVIVIGNAIEKDPTLIKEMAEAVHAANHSEEKITIGFNS